MSLATWTAPGVRVADHEHAIEETDVEADAAIPVFMCWASTGKMDIGLHFMVSGAALHSATASYLPGMDKATRASIDLFYANGGTTCYVLVMDAPQAITSDVAKWDPKWSATTEAFKMLAQEPTITLAAMPQLEGWINDGLKSFSKQQDSASVAACMVTAWRRWLEASASREDVFHVLDTPRDPKAATQCIELLRQNPLTDTQGRDVGQYAALYGPFLSTVNNDQVPPSGAVLGQIAGMDERYGMWRAPANEPLAQVVSALYREGPCAHREVELNNWVHAEKLSINPVRNFPARGTRVWGCRTLCATPSSPYRYVQIRRTVSWIERNLDLICRFAIFEPNHELTWLQLRGLCGAWLRRAWLAGALAGSDEASAFSVRVGLSESMTRDDIDGGRLIVKVDVALLRAAEFVEIQLTLDLNESRGDSTSSAEA